MHIWQVSKIHIQTPPTPHPAFILLTFFQNNTSERLVVNACYCTRVTVCVPLNTRFCDTLTVVDCWPQFKKKWMWTVSFFVVIVQVCVCVYSGMLWCILTSSQTFQSHASVIRRWMSVCFLITSRSCASMSSGWHLIMSRFFWTKGQTEILICLLLSDVSCQCCRAEISV